MTTKHQDFDQDDALDLIGKLATALKESDKGRKNLNDALIQKAFGFLDANGAGQPKFS